MVLDTEDSSVEWLRVPYPVEKVQARMRRAGLPPRLAERLSHDFRSVEPERLSNAIDPHKRVFVYRDLDILHT